jgi:hypothetical protein
LAIRNFEIGSEPSGDGWDTLYQLQITNIADSEVGYTVTAERVRWNADYRPHGDWPADYRRRGDVVRGEIHPWLGPGQATVVELSSRVRDSSRLHGVIHLDAIPNRSASGRVLVRPFAVSVLLHARRIDYREGRLRYLMDRNGVVTGRYSHPDAYSSESVQISSGKAENTLETAGFMRNFDGRMLTPKWLSDTLDTEQHHGTLLIPAEERPLALLDLLDAVDSDDEHIRTLNEALSRLGSGVRVTRTED